jgi:hypothetical protein
MPLGMLLRTVPVRHIRAMTRLLIPVATCGILGRCRRSSAWAEGAGICRFGWDVGAGIQAGVASRSQQGRKWATVGRK